MPQHATVQRSPAPAPASPTHKPAPKPQAPRKSTLPPFLSGKPNSPSELPFIQRKTADKTLDDEQEEAVQFKLKTGQPNDAFEAEADRVAAAASKAPASQTRSSVSKIPSPSGKRSAIPLPDAGSPLHPNVRSRVEPILGADLGDVRVHASPQANQTARRLNAKAFTHRNHIWLNNRQDATDLALMAHESAHVVQQGAAVPDAAIPAPVKPHGEAPPVQKSFFGSIGGAIGGAWDATGGAAIDLAGDAVDAAVDFGVDTFWSIIEGISPWLAETAREIASDGVFEYLKKLILKGMDFIFSGLKNHGGILASLAETFTGLAKRASNFIEMLATFGCDTFFAALSQMKAAISEMAGNAWNAISDFLKPVGEFFSKIGKAFNETVVDSLRTLGNSAWETISNFAKKVWSYAAPIKKAGARVWNFVMDTLGLGGDGGGSSSSESGIKTWITEKAQSVWDTVKETLQPIVKPIEGVVKRVKQLLPLTAIVSLRDTIVSWIEQAGEVAANMEEDDGVVKNQASLRKRILPAIVESIGSLQAKLNFAGAWISEGLVSLASFAISLISAAASNPLLKFAAKSLSWLQEKAMDLSNWASIQVRLVFSFAAAGLGKVKQYLRPLLNLLLDLAEAIADIGGKIGSFVMGALFGWIPSCIRNPIKNFILNQILARIPIFKELLRLPDIWAKVQQVALTILTQIFVDGNLIGALWTFFKTMLNLIGLPAKLVLSIVRKAAKSIVDILRNPFRFLINLLKAIKEGFSLFFTNILTHLFSGFTDWLFGTLDEAGIKPPKDLSIRSILTLVMDILGITAAKIWEKIAAKMGPERAKKLEKMFSIATGVWGFIRRLVEKGPAAVWEDIKAKISNLWTTVMNAAIAWITEKIITEVTVKLLSMLDPSGIMAVVNSCIAIYRAIESAARYMKKMLEFVDRVFDSIAEIAAGVVATGAKFFEDAMAKAIPIAIGFLANQVGLGNLGKKIAEIVAKVRSVVDKALDWLVDKAWSAGKWILDKLKAGAQAGVNAAKNVFQWWKKRLPIAHGKEKHSIFMENGRVMMQSDKATLISGFETLQQQVTAKSARKPSKKNIDAIHARFNALRELVADLEKGRSKSSEIARKGDLSPQEQAEMKRYADKYSTLKSEANKLLAQIMSLGSDADVPPTVITWNPAAHNMGVYAKAEPLSIKPGNHKGSPPSSTVLAGEPYKTLGYRRNGSSTFYIAGHLINHNLHGSGSLHKNLVPLTRAANSDHSSKIEEVVKGQVFKSDQKAGDSHVVSYEITTSSPRGDRSDLKTAARKKYKDSADKLSRALSVISIEDKIPRTLSATAKTMVKTDSGQWSVTGGANVVTDSVSNAIPDTVPEIDGPNLTTFHSGRDTLRPYFKAHLGSLVLANEYASARSDLGEVPDSATSFANLMGRYYDKVGTEDNIKKSRQTLFQEKGAALDKLHPGVPN